jgi:hypothetical protein
VWTLLGGQDANSQAGAFKKGRDVDAIAVDVPLIIDECVSKLDANPELERSFRRKRDVPEYRVRPDDGVERAKDLLLAKTRLPRVTLRW